MAETLYADDTEVEWEETLDVIGQRWPGFNMTRMQREDWQRAFAGVDQKIVREALYRVRRKRTSRVPEMAWVDQELQAIRAERKRKEPEQQREDPWRQVEEKQNAAWSARVDSLRRVLMESDGECVQIARCHAELTPYTLDPDRFAQDLRPFRDIRTWPDWYVINVGRCLTENLVERGIAAWKNGYCTKGPAFDQWLTRLFPESEPEPNTASSSPSKPQPTNSPTSASEEPSSASAGTSAFSAWLSGQLATGNDSMPEPAATDTL